MAVYNERGEELVAKLSKATEQPTKPDEGLLWGERSVPGASISNLSIELDDDVGNFVNRRETWIVRGENKGGNRTDAFWMGIAKKLITAADARDMRAEGKEGVGVSDTIYTKSKFRCIPGGRPDGTDLIYMTKPQPMTELDFSATAAALRRKHYPTATEGRQQRTHREPGKNRRRREGWERLNFWVANGDKYGPKHYSQTIEDLTHPDKPQPPKEVEDLLELVKTVYPKWIVEAEGIIQSEDTEAATQRAVEAALRRAEARAARRK